MITWSQWLLNVYRHFLVASSDTFDGEIMWDVGVY